MELEQENSQPSEVEPDQQNTGLGQEKLIGTYRGKPCYINVSQKPAQPQRKRNLKYRGVSVEVQQAQSSQDVDTK